MIAARGLTKRYGRQLVLDGLDLTVERGERIAIVGANGAGKTTLFRCLLGLTDFDGVLEVDGAPAGPSGRKARSRIGYVPQSPPVFDLTVAGFIELFAALRGIGADSVHERLEGLGLGLAETTEKPLRALSGGMIQKVYLALALAAEAPVLLLDEPTASLDPASRAEFVHRLATLDRDVTLLLASHRLEEIEPLADRMIALADGRIAFDGPVDALRTATGVDAGLWIGVPQDQKEPLVRQLERHPAVRSAHANGAGVNVEVVAGRHLDVLHDLRGTSIDVLEVHTRRLSLDEALVRLTRSAGDEQGDRR